MNTKKIADKTERKEAKRKARAEAPAKGPQGSPRIGQEEGPTYFKGNWENANLRLTGKLVSR
jgi:hypothetical protein